ncbi:MAG: DUF899 domain-containing protein [Acidimicrobiales bacterium]|jgi:predicted dithiol-disulfide oxidoreductase (DUF899 family)
MSLPEVATRDEWLEARRALLIREKEFTRQRDTLNADRRRLPMVAVEKDYAFEGPEGAVTLADLFDGQRQLVIYHFMFDPSWDEGCPACTAGCDELSAGLLAHLGARTTAYAVVARAPYEKIAAYKEARGWTFPFFSSNGSDFNYDFHATIDESKAPLEVNFRTRADIEGPEAGKLHWILEQEQPFENPGFSFFLRDGAAIFHTNSTFARGTEECSGSYGILDHTALGRQEDWEEPKGRSDDPHPAIPDFAPDSAGEG